MSDGSSSDGDVEIVSDGGQDIDFDDGDSDEEALIEKRRQKRKEMLYRLQRQDGANAGQNGASQIMLSTPKPPIKFATISAGATDIYCDDDDDDDSGDDRRDGSDDEKMADTLVNEALMLAEGGNVIPTPRNQNAPSQPNHDGDYYNKYLESMQEERLKEEEERRKRLEARRLALLHEPAPHEWKCLKSSKSQRKKEL